MRTLSSHCRHQHHSHSCPAAGTRVHHAPSCATLCPHRASSGPPRQAFSILARRHAQAARLDYSEPASCLPHVKAPHGHKPATASLQDWPTQTSCGGLLVLEHWPTTAVHKPSTAVRALADHSASAHSSGSSGPATALASGIATGHRDRQASAALHVASDPMRRPEYQRGPPCRIRLGDRRGYQPGDASTPSSSRDAIKTSHGSDAGYQRRRSSMRRPESRQRRR